MAVPRNSDGDHDSIGATAAPTSQSQVPTAQHQQKTQPTNFSAISALSDSPDAEELQNQRTPIFDKSIQLPESSFHPPQASTAISALQSSPPPSQRPSDFGTRRSRNDGKAVAHENHGGSYLSSASSNANSWSFEVFGKDNNQPPPLRTPPVSNQQLSPQHHTNGQAMHRLNFGANVFENEQNYRANEVGNGDQDFPDRVIYRPKAGLNLSSTMDANNLTPPRRNPRNNFAANGSYYCRLSAQKFN